ncbi:unnamed protein product [Nyctereutes procyonoides]|uniref:Cytochrome b-c1 complex subunit 7 n=1 Tax=Nyctereutes procyonoides TaxID=34880 RepID=A0A811Y9R4_NYCPR|nr:unnamed protein product [Nyctereutes procyonoides]
MRDDTVYENDDVKETARTLPENLYNDRMFHIKRALDLTMKQQILELSERRRRKKKKYLKEVIQERKEREEWAKK